MVPTSSNHHPIWLMEKRNMKLKQSLDIEENLDSEPS